MEPIKICIREFICTHTHPYENLIQYNTIYLLLYAHQCKHMCIRISILSLLYDIVKSELDLLFVAPLSAGVKQRNSGLDAWASTQLQAADLGTASRLRYFRQSIGSREPLDQTVVLVCLGKGFLRLQIFPETWKPLGLTTQLREWRPEINSYPRFSMPPSRASARKIHIWNWSESQVQQRWAKRSAAK